MKPAKEPYHPFIRLLFAKLHHRTVLKIAAKIFASRFNAMCTDYVKRTNKNLTRYSDELIFLHKQLQRRYEHDIEILG